MAASSLYAHYVNILRENHSGIDAKANRQYGLVKIDEFLHNAGLSKD
jgi:hypothetical protein